MSYSYSNLGAGGHSQSNLVPGAAGNNAHPQHHQAQQQPGGFSDPSDAENQYDNYYGNNNDPLNHPQAPPQYPAYGGNSPAQPPYIHPGYAHNQAYSDDYGSSANLNNNRHDTMSPPHNTPSPAPSYGNIPPSDSIGGNSNNGRDVLQPVGPRIMSPSTADEPNVAPHQAVHWVSADQHGRLGVPGSNTNAYNDSSNSVNNTLYPTYSGDTFTSNVNPFDAPMDQPLAPGSNPNEDIPLLGQSQHGRFGSGYSQAMLPGAMPMGPGGFMDPNMMHHDDDDEQSQVRYGRIPQRVPRRLKTIKQVSLFRGNLVLDVPVPKSLLAACPLKEDREFTRMRYTAATCDPDNFMEERYSLRQQLMSPPRQVELMIVMTMYNEDDNLYTRTMYGVQKNIQHLCSRNKSRMWGKDAWKKVVVVIVSDGRKKVNSRTLSVLATQGVYQDGVAKNVVNGKPVTCHIYEYTTQIAVTPDLKYKGAESGIVPVQIIFALKEENQKKINSHRWFFNAFARCLNPNVCVLLDVGTRPGPTSIYHLWKAFDKNSNVGGACGEIVTLKGKYMSSLLNPLVAAQNFEYKMSNILDKPLESVFGYITVLPGAFSAYRWHALQNDSAGNGPLKEYFKGETLESSVDADLLTKNMYLAEDRVLCWELVSKRQSRWILHYVKSAYGITDTPDTIPELISQRRRWLNGSFFAAIHATVKFGYLYRSDHSFIRKFWLHIELVYQLFQQLFAWFSLANYFIAFSILSHSLEDTSFGLTWAKYVNATLHYIYLGLLVMCFLLSMGNKPSGSKKMYLFAMVWFAIITAYMIFAAFFITVKGVINAKNAIEADGGKLTIGDIFTNPIFRSIVISLMATYGCWIFASLIFLDPWHLLTSFLQYLLLAPTWINILTTYALCNVHDISWGTKGSTTVSVDLGVVKASGDDKVDIDIPADEKDIEAAYEDAKHVLASKPPPGVKKVDLHAKMEDSYKNIRTNVVLIWALTNGALVAGIIGSGASASFAADGSSEKVNVYMTVLLVAIAALAFVKTVGATIYMIFWMFQG